MAFATSDTLFPGLQSFIASYKDFCVMSIYGSSLSTILDISGSTSPNLIIIDVSP